MRKREEAEPMEKPLIRRKRTIIVTVVPALVFLCLLSRPVRMTLRVPCCTQTAPALANKIRFRISESESDRALPDARIHIVYRSDEQRLERPGRTPREITQRLRIREILGMSVSR